MRVLAQLRRRTAVCSLAVRLAAHGSHIVAAAGAGDCAVLDPDNTLAWVGKLQGEGGDDGRAGGERRGRVLTHLKHAGP